MDDLAQGEHVIFEGHPSWRSTLDFYLKGIGFGIAVGVVLYGASRIFNDDFQAGWGAGGFALFVAGVVIIGYLRRIGTTYAITNRRLHIARGIISKRTQEARLERVQNVNTNQSALERILRVGTVDFDTAGTGDHDFSFRGVANPSQVVQAVDRAQREAAQDPGSRIPPDALGDPQYQQQQQQPPPPPQQYQEPPPQYQEPPPQYQEPPTEQQPPPQPPPQAPPSPAARPEAEPPPPGTRPPGAP